MNNNPSSFKPYIPASTITPELTVTSIITGIILAVIFGAANAYLGLRVGMTISASIPAAVIAMGVTRIILKKNSILESNMVQTIGSAGESVAGGAIFTMPALFLWAKEGVMGEPNLVMLIVITVFAALIGIFFMIPLRNSIIVQEHGLLPYPEAQACAEVLLAGEEKGSSAKSVFSGMGIAALFKFAIDGLKLVPEVISIPLKQLKTEFTTEIYPAVVSVGYICGFRISSYLFSGGLLAWFVIIPAITVFGGESVLYPCNASIQEIYTSKGPGAIWSSYIRYIGAGALATAGIISLVKSLPLIVRTFSSAIKGLKNSSGSIANERTSNDLSIKTVLTALGVLLVASIFIFPNPTKSFPLLGLLCSLMIIVFGFFFATVSSKMVGLVGSSNNPVSGMAIATLLICTILLKLTGNTGVSGMMSAIIIGSFICIIACLAGDMSQDLKTGFLLGATPKKQQIGEIIGGIISALTIGGVLVLLDNAWEFGSKQLAAPQATLMKLVIEGVMNGNLPWNLVFIGAAISVTIEVLGLPALPIAIGIYLPLELTAPIMVGGAIRKFIDSRNKEKCDDSSNGVLFCSGLIAGEGLVGVLLAVITVCGISGNIAFGEKIPSSIRSVGAYIALAGLIAIIILKSKTKKNEKA